MRRGNNSKRSRNGRPGGPGGGGGGGGGGGRLPPNMNRSLESSSPEGNKVRGNAGQLFDRYTNLAREAQSAGDRVAAEGYLQYAEHYYRVLSASGQQRKPNGQGGDQQGSGDGNGQGDGRAPMADGQQRQGQDGGNSNEMQASGTDQPILTDPDDDLPPVS